MARSHHRGFAGELVERLAAGAILVATSPLLAGIAIAVKLDSPGPVFFRQRRPGKDTRMFEMLKFRTMVVGATELPLGLDTSVDDPRVTRVGRVLRELHLDELPQIVNVVRGEMSFIGPRPALPHHLENYNRFELRRFEVKPGLTGLAQVSGNNALSWEERIELDVHYVDNRSLLGDLSIIARTLTTVVKREGLYGTDGFVRDKGDLRERDTR